MYIIIYIFFCFGVYIVIIKYGGQFVFNFFSKLQVEFVLDIFGVQCYGFGIEGQGVFCEVIIEFNVDVWVLIQIGGLYVKVCVVNFLGNLMEIYVQD